MQRISHICCLLAWLSCLSGQAFSETLAPQSVAGAQTIDTQTAKSLFDRGTPFIDVRKQEDYANGHIPGAHHLPFKSDFSETKLSTIVAKKEPVVIYCNGIHCMGSSLATEQAVAWRWPQVYYYRDGMPGWKSENYPKST